VVRVGLVIHTQDYMRRYDMADIENASFVIFEEDIHHRLRTLITEIKDADIDLEGVAEVLDELANDVFLSLESGAELDEQLQDLLDSRENKGMIEEVVRELEFTDPDTPILRTLRVAIGDSLIPRYGGTYLDPSGLWQKGTA
jgi:chaperonin cofactor prefoldin